MKKLRALLGCGLALATSARAISTNDIQLWTGCGTNHAAMVIEWSTPQILNYTTVPAPVATKTMVWGYNFNGTVTGTQMMEAIIAANPRLYAVLTYYPGFGSALDGLGYNLKGDGNWGVTDGTNTYSSNAFTSGLLINSDLDVDAASPLNSGDLFWSGFNGPYWIQWNELNNTGGFPNSPNRGTNQYASYDPDTYTWTQGEWQSGEGLDYMIVQDGSWLGLTISAAGYDGTPGDPATTAFVNNEQAPPSPDGTYTAYVCNTNDFAVQVVSSTNLDSSAPYNTAAAMLGRPDLRFFDKYDGAVTNRNSLIDPAYWQTPAGNNILTEILPGGQVTVQLGRPVTHNPNNPYGMDFILYSYGFFGVGETDSDATDLSTATMGGLDYHTAIVSVSPDGTNWYTYPSTDLFPDNAYRWDDESQSWTDEQLNPTKPINPVITPASFDGQTVAAGIDQMSGGAGGVGFNLAASGFSSIQYIRVQPPSGDDTVIDAIAAVNPPVVGDALSIDPGNVSSGITNLAFENPANANETSVSLNFDSVNETTKISTVALSEFSAFAPMPGNVQTAFQITAAPLGGTNAVALTADVQLSAGTNYSGNGSDLRLLSWNGNAWTLQPFTFNAASNQLNTTGLTNLSAYVVSQLGAQLCVQSGASGFSYQFIPFPCVTNILQCSTDLMTWVGVATNVSTNTQPVALQDPNPPANQAFYRLQLVP